jgi:hypothetical protein
MAYSDLICGMVADGIWSKFDVLQVYATQNNTTALLNLVQNNYNSALGGAPAFVVDRGFTGVHASTTVYIDTGFCEYIAPSPKMVQNSAHMSVWIVSNDAGQTSGAMGNTNTIGQGNQLAPKFTDNNTYYRTFSQGTGGVANATTPGHYVGNRSGVNIYNGYKNAVSVFSDGTASFGVSHGKNIYVLSNNVVGGSPDGSAYQTAMSSIGASLSAAEVTMFYNRLCTYMTAVGVP